VSTFFKKLNLTTKKYQMKKIYILATTLMLSSINVNAAPHEGPFLGINTMEEKQMCHMITEGDDFEYKLPSEITLTMNNNFVLATCKGEYLQDPDVIIEPGRTKVSNCRIKVDGHADFFEGTGGFTVDTYQGVVSANCKAIR